jgi:hypothetical protein
MTIVTPFRHDQEIHRRRLSAACRLVAIVIGVLSGLLVAAISKLSAIAHSLLFDIPFDAHLSATGVIPWQALPSKGRSHDL